MITLFGLWMHKKNTYLARKNIRTIDIIVDTEQKPSVTMIHTSKNYKGVLYFSGRFELEFELFDRKTNKLLKWSMQSGVNPANEEQLEDVLRPYFKALVTEKIETFDTLLKYA
ncbi:MAG: hypothetical protein KIG60_09530 [Caryophanon sp.]|nr:hypothetical protein [Caryophanon sp.]